MNLLDDIRRDMAQGTPGPWGNSQLDTREIEVAESGQPVGETYGRNDETLANARRCARIPDMEKALLAAEELATTLDADMGRLAFSPATIAALAAFRAATEQPHHSRTACAGRAILLPARPALRDRRARMQDPKPINLMTQSEVREAGWQAESRDADGHLVTTHVGFERDLELAEYVREEIGRGYTVTIWPKDIADAE